VKGVTRASTERETALTSALRLRTTRVVRMSPFDAGPLLR